VYNPDCSILPFSVTLHRHVKKETLFCPYRNIVANEV